MYLTGCGEEIGTNKTTWPGEESSWNKEKRERIKSNTEKGISEEALEKKD